MHLDLCLKHNSIASWYSYKYSNYVCNLIILFIIKESVVQLFMYAAEMEAKEATLVQTKQ